ncbi:alpha/beta-hydrolase, partial [Aureobasidium melanogenum]
MFLSAFNGLYAMTALILESDSYYPSDTKVRCGAFPLLCIFSNYHAMTVKAHKFTPEVLLSAPRRSAGVPNGDGSSVLYTTSTYSFDSHTKTVELRSLDTKSNESTLLVQENSISEPVWLPGQKDVFACLKGEDKGKTSILIATTKSTSDWKDSTYTAGSIDAPAGSLKIVQLSDSSYAVVLAAQCSPDGSLYNSETASKTHSTGKLYKSLFVRHWDDYVTPQKNTLWELALKVLFRLSEDPKTNPALSTKCNVYYIELNSFTEDPAPKPFEYTIQDFKGASSSPVFSPDGKKAVFLSMYTAGYESDKSQIFLIEDLEKDSVKRLFDQKKEGSLDKSPQNLAFSCDGKTLYFSAEDQGYGRLFALTSNPTDGEVLRPLTNTGYVSDVRPLESGDVFYTSSSLVDYSSYSIVGTSSTEAQTAKWTHSSSKGGSSLGLKASQVSSIHTPASDATVNKTVHSWVIKPSNFEEGKKYPLALLIHGGPQGSWGDSWSTRWNPAVYAEQGYVVITPNITGSTGYGQAFTDAIRKDWGGAPYNDLVNVIDWVEKHMSEVDMTRAVALGASYGGYMINWLNGHDLGRRFKALVCHDGIFSLTGQLATDELYFVYNA